MIFLGFIYGYLRPHLPAYVHSRLPVEQALVIAVLLFGCWHIPNFVSMSTSYVWFQHFYTAVPRIIPALSRQWTGSIVCAALGHSAVNFIARMSQ
jgi:membrane protease YdiL (CAAX protease family)